MAQRSTIRLQNVKSDIEIAAAILRNGGLVAMPTETVYGLAADALNSAALESIFVAKDRPHWDPLIVHIADPTMLAAVTSSISPVAQQLIDHFWPGPLTLLLPRHPGLPDAVTAGRELVGVRMPAHAVALALIRAAGRPLAAPSANRFGRISPTTAAHVLADLEGRVDAVLDAGPTSIGVESTVLDPNADPMVLYRHGGISAVEIERLTGRATHTYTPPQPQGDEPAPPQSLPSPGIGIRHYAPNARLHLVADRAELQKAILDTSAVPDIKAAAVLLPNGWRLPGFRGPTFPWGDWNNANELARNLYAGLRALDQPETRSIYAPLPPLPDATRLGDLRHALRDRLLKAARCR